MNAELQVIRTAPEFVTPLAFRIEQFRRVHRYGLGRRMEDRAEAIFAALIHAKYAPKPRKRPHLEFANIELEILRFQLRQALELNLVPPAAHLSLLEQINAIGKQIGGWIKTLPADREND